MVTSELRYTQFAHEDRTRRCVWRSIVESASTRVNSQLTTVTRPTANYITKSFIKSGMISAAFI